MDSAGTEPINALNAKKLREKRFNLLPIQVLKGVGQELGPVKSSSSGVLAEIAPRSRYNLLGGKLQRLPFSSLESTWISEVFKKEGVAVARLDRGLATESAVRVKRSNLTGTAEIKPETSKSQ